MLELGSEAYVAVYLMMKGENILGRGNNVGKGALMRQGMASRRDKQEASVARPKKEFSVR
jgi:hypothetical protein